MKPSVSDRLKSSEDWRSHLHNVSAHFQILVGIVSLSVAAIMLRLVSRITNSRTDPESELKLFGLLDLAAAVPSKNMKTIR